MNSGVFVVIICRLVVICRHRENGLSVRINMYSAIELIVTNTAVRNKHSNK